MKKALICGISGQDGAYLARLLVQKGYRVYGGSRDAQGSLFTNLRRLGIYEQIKFLSINLNDFRSVLQAVSTVQPDEVYNLSGQSSVALSFEQPVETLESIATGTLNMLEAIRFLGRPVRFYNAGSGECFGNAGSSPVNEETPFRPCSPYGVAKSAAFWELANYRQAYNIHACTGILFNHESPLRPARFVTGKIASAVCRIATGSPEKLYLGNLDIERDWGWAPEYVEAMWKMVQQPEPEDFVIATGKSYKLAEFIEQAFACAGLNWRDHVEVDALLFRPSDLMTGRADPVRAERRLGWKAQRSMPEVVRLMMDVAQGRTSVQEV
ncbi:MAG: GDP-mannose 4,6-dehydratase [Pontiellaceae bacterium]|jgi:GDPmannose 4,6-dehydratase|nr:GDP-mannose 4,6-dehydratase [Pontiellaceae bacterium]